MSGYAPQHGYHNSQHSFDSMSYQAVPNSGMGQLGAYGNPNGQFSSSTTNLYGAGAGAGDKASAYPPALSPGIGRKPNATVPFYRQKWFLWGLPILFIAAIAGVVAGVVATRHSSGSSSSKKGIGNADVAGASVPSGVVKNAAYPSLAAASTDVYSNPIYATATSAAPAAPTVASNSVASLCRADAPSWQNSSSDTYHVRTDHPKLFAGQSKFDCLTSQIAQNGYLASWNATIMANATAFANMDPVVYAVDGGLSGSGVLDVAREVQLRMKHWAYAWKVTNDTKWPDRAWQELLVASGNTSQPFGNAGNNWNTQHFLDVAEFTLAFAYAYDWMYDAWNTTQRNAIMWSIINLGLKYGLNSYTNQGSGYSWWQTTNGNWNCVCNGGLTLGALAIASEDPTGIAQQVLSHTVANAQANCMQATQPDGTWSETSDYWYFGTSGQSQMVAGLISATGSDQGLLTANAALSKTGLFHMYGMGFVEKFNYGDCGPNKYTATANGLLLYANLLDMPLYTLYQRDRIDAAEPLSMLYYDPDTTGEFWYNLPLDHYFDSPGDEWAAMRGSWTDPNQIYSAIKAGNLTGHQTHGDLDAGDFVFEALGQRWAGELCQNNYLDTGYFSSEAQGSQRWLYYRCRTEGQNTLLINQANQLVDIAPTTDFGTTNDIQSSLTWTANTTSAAYFTADLTSIYTDVTTVKRGMRLLNSRRQMLLQDEINSHATGQWRMQTNATITYSNGNSVANLALNGQKLQVQIIGSASNLTFSTLQPVRLDSDPALPSGQTDLPNPGVSVLAIDIPSGSTTLEVLFNPQWPGLSSSSFLTPSSVPLSSWSTTSHSS